MIAVLSGVPLRTLPAQGRPVPRTDTLSTRVRDSLIAAVLADTLDLDIDTLDLMPVLPTIPALRQSFSIRPTIRSYSVGGLNATEQASYASWVARFRRATLRMDLTPIAFTGDTSATAGRPPVGFNAMSPISARLDVPLRMGDTVRVFAQSSSFPGTLSAIDAQALGAVGTSTIDLDAITLGVAARVGMRYTVSRAIGDDGVAISLRGGVEYDPKPSGIDAVSWRGTTVRGGLGLSRTTATISLGASAEVTRSFADSLGGKNLFPGGGAVNVDARALRFFGTDGDGYVALNGFYSKPIDIERPDQPTRLFPVGDFFGATVSGAIPLGRVSLLPTLSHMRESSNASAIVNGRVTTLDATGYTSTASLALSIPIGSVLTVTPEVGGALGTVGQVVSAQFPRRVRSLSFSDAIRGGWFALELTLTR